MPGTMGMDIYKKHCGPKNLFGTSDDPHVDFFILEGDLRSVLLLLADCERDTDLESCTQIKHPNFKEGCDEQYKGLVVAFWMVCNELNHMRPRK